MTSGLQERYKGARITVVHCEGAIESMHEALQHLDKHKRVSMTNRMIIQINRLVSGERLSSDSYPIEGELPRRPGKPTKHFRALKRIPLRAYCWSSTKYPGIIFISHYIYKNWDKLAESDTIRVASNWKRIEENGDER